ncbi:MAG: hypothetical protein CML17_12910 [Pusillimonas sp.]|nr:hypothetical protein [Pusillimonas sp.]
MMSHVDLCSGIGGFALGFEWAGLSKPVMFCDVEPWSRKVLVKHWPDVLIAKDVKELASDPARLVPDCDILTAGYPCQPFSVAGLQRGAQDDRHVWPEIFTIVQAKRPNWCVFENVPGHINLGLNQVLSDLEDKAGYAVQTFCVGAVALNAPHRRQRIFVIAHANSQGEPDGTKHEQRMVANTSRSKCSTGAKKPRVLSSLQKDGAKHDNTCGRSENVADTDNEGSQGRLSGRQGAEWQGEHGHAQCSGTAHRQPAKDWWAVEPPVGRVAHGIPGRVDRLRGLGNAIVPQIAMQIGLTIKAVRDE